MGVRKSGVTLVDDLSEEELLALVAIGLGVTHRKLIPSSGIVSNSGNNLILTPTTGAKLRLAYLSYNPSAAVELAFRFGAAGGLFLRNNITVGGSVIAKDFGDFRYVEGEQDEILNLNLSAAVPTVWNALYTEE